MTDAQKAALLAFVAGGKGFIGVHSATNTFYTWPEYGALIGGYMANHPWVDIPATLRVEDTAHPSTAHSRLELHDHRRDLRVPQLVARQRPRPPQRRHDVGAARGQPHR